MPFENRITRALAPLERLPLALRKSVRSLILGRVVKLVGTAGLDIEELGSGRAVVYIRNRTKVQNHIGGVHAAAMALVAETATGFVVGMNVPDSSVPVIKSMKVSFKRRAKGSLRATATLDDQQQQLIRESERGEVMVPCRVTDEAGEEPITVEMLWAWTPKRS